MESSGDIWIFLNWKKHFLVWKVDCKFLIIFDQGFSSWIDILDL